MPRANRSRWKLILSSAVVVLASGITFSPMIVSAVQKVPLVHVIQNWVKGTNAAPYVRNVQQSATDKGITMTITDVLYGPSQLSFGYIVSPGQPGFPHGGVVGLGSPNGMQFFVNGRRVHLQGMGEGGATVYGFKGMVTLTGDGTSETLPDSFTLQIVLHKIGHRLGTWKFFVPVSRQNMKPEQTFLPMTTKTVGNETVTIKEVQLYPTGGMIDYAITAPVGVKTPLNLTLLNQDKDVLDTLTADHEKAKSHVTSDGLETWSYSQPFRVPGEKPTSLIISPSMPSESKSRSMPLKGPFPVTMYSGVFGKVTITGTHVKGNTVTVYYDSASNPGKAGFHFSIKDKTHPNERFGGTLGEKAGPSGSDEYMNVYQFSSDVSSDELVIKLPAQSKDDVFEVPLRNNKN